jgi:serine/threonine protein kinase
MHEARLGMELQHTNLIRVYELVKDPIQPYFVMELFTGYHLKMPIARPSIYPMPKKHLHRIIEQAGLALAYMHEKGWVHRDIKPENILYNKAGEVRVIDYALARKASGGLLKMLEGKIPRQGTKTYMSPEQIRCESPAPAVDIYSFGITCYELACGRPPFRANSSQELLEKHLSERPLPLTTHNKLVTPEFNDLVLKMIQKRPADRFGSMLEVLSRFRPMRMFQDDPDSLELPGHETNRS